MTAENATTMLAGDHVENKEIMSVCPPSVFLANIELPPHSAAGVDRSENKAAEHEAMNERCVISRRSQNDRDLRSYNTTARSEMSVCTNSRVSVGKTRPVEAIEHSLIIFISRHAT